MEKDKKIHSDKSQKQDQLIIDPVSKSFAIKRINELTELRENYAINLATEFGGYSWDYLPKGKFNVC